MLLTYVPDIETLDGRGGGRCGVYYLSLDGGAAGAISVTGHARSHGEIGYEIVPALRGRGLATEAVCAVVEGIAGWHGFTVLSAQALAGNIPSRRVLEKAGFARVGAKLCWMERRGQPLGVEFYRRHTGLAGERP